MKTRVVLLLSIAILITAVVWLAIQPSPEPVVAALAAIAGIVSQLRDRPKPSPSIAALESEPKRAETSLLVMPFANLSSDPENEYFSDGLTEELIAALAPVPALRVISRYSAMRLKGTSQPLDELATDLSVEFVVEGGVRKDGDAIRITIHLVNVGRDTELWSEKYDGTMDDVFSFQESVAGAIVHALHLRFEPDRVGVARAPADLRAFEAYLRGRHEMGYFTREAIERARRFFSAGLEILGESALLHAGLGHASFRLAHIVPGAMAGYMSEAADSAQRSLDLDPDLGAAHVLSGLVDWKRRSLGSALRHFKDALQADPDDAEALTWVVFCFAEVGDLDTVGLHVNRLVLVDPLNPFTRWVEGVAALLGARLTDALDAFDRALSLGADSTNSIALAAFTDFRLGNVERAQDRLQHMAQMGQDDVWTYLGAGLLAAIEGRPIQLPEHVVSDSRKDETFAWFIAECYAILGRNEEVIEWLDYALEWGFSNVSFVTSDATAVHQVWTDPAFQDWIVRADARRRQVLATATRGGS